MTEAGASSGPSAPAESLRQLIRFFGADASARSVELLLNPTSKLVGTVTATVETATHGPPRYDLLLHVPGLTYAFSAFRHAAPGPAPTDTSYTIRLSPTDGADPSAPQLTDAFAGSLRCSVDDTQYSFCDDPSNFYSYPRELGALIVVGERFSVLLPRVDDSGAAAQFRVLRDSDSIIPRFFTGKVRQHLLLISGQWSEGGCIEFVDIDSADASRDVLFRVRESGGTLLLQYRHPVSAFQAFCVALSLVHHAQHQQRVTQALVTDLRHKVLDSASVSATEAEEMIQKLFDVEDDVATWRAHR